MTVEVLNHPLINILMTNLRSQETSSSKFRHTAKKISSLMAYEIFKDLKIERKKINTPLESYVGIKAQNPKPCVISILRAGLIISEGITDIFDKVSIGHIGMYRNEKTLSPVNYLIKLPSNLQNRQCFLCDPMLATGGSAISSLETLKKNNASDITLVCLLASDEGIRNVKEKFSDVKIICAQKDDKLNEKGFIVPGLGDAGDRIFDT
ncbi:MAG: uracil phosphoribosyltransferase [Candidatus Puniceispirillales bacterium]